MVSISHPHLPATQKNAVSGFSGGRWHMRNHLNQQKGAPQSKWWLGICIVLRTQQRYERKQGQSRVSIATHASRNSKKMQMQTDLRATEHKVRLVPYDRSAYTRLTL